MTIDELTERIIGLAMKIHRAMGPGFLEAVYHRCLELELSGAGIHFESHFPLSVFYQSKIVGQFEADLLVKTQSDSLIIELKACENLTKAHEVQTVNYLTATGIDHGLLINFGSRSLEFKHKHRVYRPKAPHSSRQDEPNQLGHPSPIL